MFSSALVRELIGVLTKKGKNVRTIILTKGFQTTGVIAVLLDV